MASTNDFLVQLLAKLDTSSVNTEFEALKKRLANDPVIQKVTLDTSMSKQAIRSMASEIHNELGKAFKSTGIESFDITVKDVESILNSAVKESNKLAKELDTASSKAQKFLAQFNNKSGGTLVNSKEFKAVQDAISGLGKTHSIDDLNKAMNTLETTYNNMVSSLRNSGKSLNPFINAKNEMATMDDTIKGIGLEFEKLANKPKAVSDAIKQLSVQQANVNSHTIGTQEWADSYGKLQQMIQKVKSEISNLQKAQSANVSTQIFNTADLDKQGKVYIQKVRNTIEAIKPELESKLRSAGYTDIEIKGVEKANGQIKSLTATVTDATGAFKQLNFQREKIQGKGKAQFGFVQTDDVKVIGTLSSSVEKVQGNLSTLKSKWEEQSILVGDFKTKVEQLETSLASVGSKGELNGLKTQIETLKNEASQIAEVNKIQHSLGVGDYDVQVASLTSKFEKWGLSAENVSQKMSELNTAYRNLQNANTDDKRLQAEKVYQQALEKTKNELALMSLQSASISDRTNLSNKIQVWLDKNTKASKKARTTLQGYIATLNSADKMGVPALQKIKSEFTQIEIAERSAGRLGKSFIDTLKAGAQKFVEWGLASNAVMAVWSKSKEMVQAVYDIDTAMTNLYKVTDETAERYDHFLDSASKKAKELGQSVTNLVEQTTNWAKLGYSLDDAEKLAEISSIYSNVGEVDNDTAVSDMVTAMKAFNIEASDAITIVDMLNTLGNKYATSAADLGAGLSRSASAMATAGTDIEKTLAMLTGGAEITQSAEEFGNMLKIGSMRVRGKLLCLHIRKVYMQCYA